MRIAFFVTEFPCLSETFVLAQITGLIEAGHELEIFAERPPREKIIQPEVMKFQLLDRTHYVDQIPGNSLKRVFNAIALFARSSSQRYPIFARALNGSRFGKLASSTRLLFSASTVMEAGGQFDIVHCHFGPNGNLAVCLREIGALTGRILTTFHGYDIRDGIERGGQIYARLIKGGDLVLSISEYNRKHLVEFGFPEEKIRHHPVGIDVRKYRFKQRKLRPGERIRIITVARLVREKGITHALKAIAQIARDHPNTAFEYVLVGDGYLRAELEKEASELQLNQVIFAGSKTQEEVRDALDESHIFLLPSVAEALPVVLMEAQACGLPCVCTRVGSAHEVVVDGQSALMTEAADANALATILSGLMLVPESWAQMSESGRRHVEAHFDNRVLIPKLEAFYREALGAS